MNHEETVALTAGGHTFGKAHGAGDPSLVGAPPEGSDLALQGLGWSSGHESGMGEHTITSGIEGSWVNTPTQWSENYFRLLLDYEYELVRSPAGAQQWQPINQKPEDMAPAAHDPSKRVPTMMTTADMALKMDPEFAMISEKFRNDHEAFKDAFARAWFKLTHRDMGPKVRYLGPEVPREDLIWQDPVPAGSKPSDADVADFKAKILDAGLSIGQLVKTAWASASTYRKSDHRGGANGARLRLAPQKDWAVNEPEELARILGKIDELRGSLSMADAIVLAGTAAVEKAARDAGFAVDVPFTGGRGDAAQDWTDIESFDVMEPAADGFRNYLKTKHSVRTEELLLDRAALLGLSGPEMTVLLGGLRVLGANYKDAPLGVLTDRKGQLTNDYFVNLLDMDVVWEVVDTSGDEEFIGYDRGGKQERWHATRTDLIFGSNSQLRATAEVYAEKGHEEKFVRDFVKVWTKVMNADRFDLRSLSGNRRPADHFGVDVAQRVGEQLILVGTRAGAPPGECDFARAMFGFEPRQPNGCAIEDSGAHRHVGHEGEAKAVVDHLHQGMQRSAHHPCARTQIWPVASGKGVVLQAMAVFEQQQAVGGDITARYPGAFRRFIGRAGDVQGIVEQDRGIDVAAIERHCQQDAVELSAMERVARRLTGFLAQVELQIGPGFAKPRKHRRQQEGGDGRDHAEPQVPGQRLAFGPRHVGQFLGFTQDASCLFGDFRSQAG